MYVCVGLLYLNIKQTASRNCTYEEKIRKKETTKVTHTHNTHKHTRAKTGTDRGRERKKTTWVVRGWGGGGETATLYNFQK